MSVDSLASAEGTKTSKPRPRHHERSEGCSRPGLPTPQTPSAEPSMSVLNNTHRGRKRDGPASQINVPKTSKAYLTFDADWNRRLPRPHVIDPVSKSSAAVRACRLNHNRIPIATYDRSYPPAWNIRTRSRVLNSKSPSASPSSQVEFWSIKSSNSPAIKICTKSRESKRPSRLKSP